MKRLLQRLDRAAERHRRMHAQLRRALAACRAISSRNGELRFELRALHERLRLVPAARFREALFCIEVSEAHGSLAERCAMLSLAQGIARANEDLCVLERAESA